MMQPHPDSLIVEKLGGPAVVGRICRVRPQAVSQWKRHGIPAARRDYLQLLKPEAFAEVAVPVAQEARDAA